VKEFWQTEEHRTLMREALKAARAERAPMRDAMNAFWPVAERRARMRDAMRACWAERHGRR
jgi:hypothetical protein